MVHHGADRQQAQALSTFVKLMRGANGVAADVHAPLFALGLTVSQFGILEALYHKGPLCQKELAKKILKTTGNLTTVINNLEKQGLVTRRRNENDKRYITVLLTPAGRTLISDIFPLHAKRISRRLSLLNEDEQKMLARLCAKLLGPPSLPDNQLELEQGVDHDNTTYHL